MAKKKREEGRWNRGEIVSVKGNSIVEHGAGTIAVVPGLNEGGVFEWLSNIDLIAAAPDLLAACKRMLCFEKFKGTLGDENRAASYLDAMHKLRDAIAKAEGK